MKIYTSKIGPNPAALKNVVELKKMDIPIEEIDLWAAKTVAKPI